MSAWPLDARSRRSAPRLPGTCNSVDWRLGTPSPCRRYSVSDAFPLLATQVIHTGRNLSRTRWNEEPHRRGKPQTPGAPDRGMKRHPLRAAALGHGLAMGCLRWNRSNCLSRQLANAIVGVLRGGGSQAERATAAAMIRSTAALQTSGIVHRREHHRPQPVQQTGASPFFSGLNRPVRSAIGERTSQRWPTRPRATAEAVSIGEWLSDASGGWCARSSLVDQARRRAGSSPSWWC